MAGKYISLTAKDGGSFRAYLAPAASGKGPGIVLCQEIFGINAYVREVADQYATEGYTVLAPDLFWRREPNVELGYTPQDWERAFDFFKRFNVDKGIEDIGVAAQTLHTRPETAGGGGARGGGRGGGRAGRAAGRGGGEAAGGGD